MRSDEKVIAKILQGKEVTNTQEEKALKRLDGMTERAARVMALALVVRFKLDTRKKKNSKKKNNTKKNSTKKNNQSIS